MIALLTTLTLLLQFLLGFGLVALFPVAWPRHMRLPLSLMAGLAGSTFLLFMMECLSIPLREVTFLPAMALAAVGVNMIRRKEAIQQWRHLFKAIKFKLRPHEILLLAVIAFRLGALLWLALYQPVVARDNMVGMDLAAKYAVAEGHFRSSLFSSPITGPELGNQPYYAPFTSFSEVIFRLTGSLFGVAWLAALGLSFVAFLYGHLRRISHSLVAGILILVFLAAPEVASYLSLVLTDFANMAFLVTALVMLLIAQDAKEEEKGPLWGLSAMFMAFACWSRSDTVFHLLALLPVVMLFHRADGFRKWAPRVGVWAAAGFLSFAIWSFVFVPLAFSNPPVYDTYPDLFNLARLGRIVQLLVGEVLVATPAFGFFFYLAAPFVLILPWIFRERKSLLITCTWLSVFLALVMIAQVFPDATVANTLKRGVMKLFAIGMLAIAQSVPVQRLCAKLSKWQG